MLFTTIYKNQKNELGGSYFLQIAVKHQQDQPHEIIVFNKKENNIYKRFIKNRKRKYNLIIKRT